MIIVLKWEFIPREDVCYFKTFMKKIVETKWKITTQRPTMATQRPFHTSFFFFFSSKCCFWLKSKEMPFIAEGLTECDMVETVKREGLI